MTILRLSCLIGFLITSSTVRGDELAAQLTALAEAHKGKVAIAVRHLSTGQEFFLHSDEIMPTASLIKLPIMIETYIQDHEKKRSLDDMLTLQSEDKVPGSGILTRHFSAGAQFSLRDAVRLMIAFSDNTATNLVLDAIGLDATNQRMAALGFPQTRIHAKVFRGSTTSLDPERTRKYGLGSTTAREMITLLTLLHAGKLGTLEATSAMLGHLRACEDKDGFPRFLSPGIKVAHKSGAVNDARTEAGILELTSGPVALCVLTTQNEDQRWTKDNAGLLLRARAAQVVAEYFAKATPEKAGLNRIDRAVEAAIQRGDTPGAVVVVVRDDKTIWRKAYGQRSVEPKPEPLTVDTLYDLASLTKPIATAAAIHLLAERGQLQLTDPVAKYWPAFAQNGKDDITLEQCLLHTTGLTADNVISDYADGREKAWERIAALKPEVKPGTRFRYSDVGFIVLGEVAARVAKQPLNQFVEKEIFAPLQMTDTLYTPTQSLLPRIAPTGKRDGQIIRGVVHDPRAHRLGGVAGHAGLFGTADDLARFARMLLHQGELDGKRIFQAKTVQQYTQPHVIPAGADAKPRATPLLRSLGWDVDTAYSSQRGLIYKPGTGYGHTGFTGTSIWIDPSSRTAIIILANRVHPHDKGASIALRREIATIVAEQMSK
ncbi:MAG: serine hydrolase [Bacteroidales bacterium]|nr:serine hydrolase [Bacteroidales bacterium]